MCCARWDVPTGQGRAARSARSRARSASTTSPNIPGGHRVTAAQARAAGYPDAESAQKDLDRRPARHTYAIAVSYLAPDERPDLAADDQLSADDVEAIAARLDRWDAATEPWTQAVPGR